MACGLSLGMWGFGRFGFVSDRWQRSFWVCGCEDAFCRALEEVAIPKTFSFLTEKEKKTSL